MSAMRSSSSGELHELGLPAAARAIRNGEVSWEVYVGKLLERASGHAAFNAFVSIDETSVLGGSQASRSIASSRTQCCSFRPLRVQRPGRRSSGSSRWAAKASRTSSRNTHPSSSAGVPGISLPMALNSEGLPLGLELDAAAVVTVICSPWLDGSNKSSGACQAPLGSKLQARRTYGPRLYWENNANNFNAVDISLPRPSRSFPARFIMPRAAGRSGAITSSSTTTRWTRAVTSRRGKSRSSSRPRSARRSDHCGNRREVGSAHTVPVSRATRGTSMGIRWERDIWPKTSAMIAAAFWARRP